MPDNKVHDLDDYPLIADIINHMKRHNNNVSVINEYLYRLGLVLSSKVEFEAILKKPNFEYRYWMWYDGKPTNVKITGISTIDSNTIDSNVDHFTVETVDEKVIIGSVKEECLYMTKEECERSNPTTLIRDFHQILIKFNDEPNLQREFLRQIDKVIQKFQIQKIEIEVDWEGYIIDNEKFTRLGKIVKVNQADNNYHFKAYSNGKTYLVCKQGLYKTLADCDNAIKSKNFPDSIKSE